MTDHDPIPTLADTFPLAVHYVTVLDGKFAEEQRRFTTGYRDGIRAHYRSKAALVRAADIAGVTVTKAMKAEPEMILSALARKAWNESVENAAQTAARKAAEAEVENLGHALNQLSDAARTMRAEAGRVMSYATEAQEAIALGRNPRNGNLAQAAADLAAAGARVEVFTEQVLFEARRIPTIAEVIRQVVAGTYEGRYHFYGTGFLPTLLEREPVKNAEITLAREIAAAHVEAKEINYALDSVNDGHAWGSAGAERVALVNAAGLSHLVTGQVHA